jgi:hypothetical protein
VADDAVEQLLDRLRPDAVALVDAFQIPDRLLGALGRSDGKELFARARAAKINDCSRNGLSTGTERCSRTTDKAPHCGSRHATRSRSGEKQASRL